MARSRVVIIIPERVKTHCEHKLDINTHCHALMTQVESGGLNVVESNTDSGGPL